MSPRSIKENEKIKDERRSQILLSALKVFTKEGFAAAKISDIADDAKVSYGLVYHYFSSKDEIYTELIEYAVNSISKTIEEIKMNTEKPVEQIHQIAVRVLNAIEHKKASRYYYLLVINAITCEAMPESTARIIKESTARLKMLSDIIAEGQIQGQIQKGDPDELAIMCISTAIGIASLKVSGIISKVPDPDILMRIIRVPDNKNEVKK